MLARREFLRTGGVLLAGLGVAPIIGRWPRWKGNAVDIYLRSDRAGGDVWFDPIGVFVEPGQAVRWINVENVHTSTAYHPDNGGRPRRIPPTATPWDSGYLLGAGDSFTMTPSAEGVYDYCCLPHEAAGMVGRLVVGDPTRSPVGLGDDAIPSAALRAFPSVAQIVGEGIVRR